MGEAPPSTMTNQESRRRAYAVPAALLLMVCSIIVIVEHAGDASLPAERLDVGQAVPETEADFFNLGEPAPVKNKQDPLPASEDDFIQSTVHPVDTVKVVNSPNHLGSRPSTPSAKVLKSLCELRAYSELAYHHANDIKGSKLAGNTALINMVIDFAKDGTTAREAAMEQQLERKDQIRDIGNKVAVEGTKSIPDLPVLVPGDSITVTEKKLKYNVVVEFWKALSKVHRDFPIGLGHYLLSRLEKEIMEGNSVITVLNSESGQYGTASIQHKFAPLVGFNHKNLGLDANPDDFTTLAVLQSTYLKRLKLVKEENAGADSLAAAAVLRKNQKKKYVSFLDRELEKRDARVKKFNMEAEAQVRRAIEEAYESQGKLQALPQAGIVSAKDIQDISLRSKNQVVAD